MTGRVGALRPGNHQCFFGRSEDVRRIVGVEHDRSLQCIAETIALFPLFSNEQSRELDGFHTEEVLCPKRL